MEIVADKNETNIRTFKATERLLQHNAVCQFFPRTNWVKHTNMAAMNVQFRFMHQIELTWKLHIPTFYTGSAICVKYEHIVPTKKKNFLVTKMKIAWWYKLLISLGCSTLTIRKTES